MQFKQHKTDHTSLPVALLYGFGGGIAASLIGVVLSALIMTAFNLEMSASVVLSTLSLVFGSLIGGYIAVRQLKNNGLLYGMSTGGLVFLATLVVSLVFSQNSISLTTLFHLFGSLLSGGIGGIVAANRRNRRDVKL